MKIFIVSFFFYPDNNPRSNRWTALVNEFQKVNNKITVFTTSDVPINYSNEILFKIVKNKYFNNHTNNKIEMQNKKYNFKKEFIFFIYRIIIKKIQWPDFSWWWIRPCIKNIEKEILLEKPDLIITVSHPFSSHVIGYNIKKKYKDINWIMDCGDPFYFSNPSPNNNFIYKYLNKYFEKKCFNKSEKIFVTTQGTLDIYKNNFNLNDNKIVVIPPMRSFNYNFKSTFNYIFPYNVYNILYLGTLYSDIRNPKKVINFLNHLSLTNQIKINLTFLGNNNDIIIKDFQNDFFSLEIISEVSRESTLSWINKTNILLNIGNLYSYQLPSKLVDYVATGKPILNFSYIEDDSSELFLKNYESTKTICINNKNNILLFRETTCFIKSTKDINNIEKNFWTEKYSINKISRQYLQEINSLRSKF
jgi:hypothetical protein